MAQDFSQRPPPSYDAPVDRGPEVVATHLAPQLGSDSKWLSKGEFDIRKLSVIEKQDIAFLIYAEIRGKKTNVWKIIKDEYLNLQIAVGGRGRRDIIRMEGVSKGGLPDVGSDYEKPGWVQRNFTQRNWKKQMDEERI